jgi:hypothetical protein
MKVRPNVGSPLAARRANEPRLKIRQPNIIPPSVATDRDVVAAPIIRAIDQELDERISAKVIFSGRETCPMIPPIGAGVKPLAVVVN